MGVICVIGKECWATEYRNLYLQYCPIALLRLLFIYIPTQCVNVFFPYSFANRSDFWFSANIIEEKWDFGVVGWVFIIVLGFFVFVLASNRAFILFIVVLIYVYFMSEIEHILAAVHTDTCFTMNDCLPVFYCQFIYVLPIAHYYTYILRMAALCDMSGE